jgi:hypothetical protein
MVVYGCEAWSFASRLEHKLSVFENRTPWKIFGTKMEDVTVDWRRLHNVGMQDLRAVIRVIKPVIMRQLGKCDTCWGKINLYGAFIAKSESYP